ncbi:MAG: type II toxin-antitoxin system RelE/ParE family toxin, partial [Hyphomicrobium sp.]
MRVFKTRDFARFARKEGIDDARLCEAIERAERGLIDADLGGGVIKQRVARLGKGRSGGYRTLIAYRTKARTVFVYGFAKSDKDNVSTAELAALRRLATEYLGYNSKQVDTHLKDGAWTEVMC